MPDIPITFKVIGSISAFAIGVYTVLKTGSNRREDSESKQDENLRKEVNTLEQKLGVAHNRIGEQEKEINALNRALGTLEGETKIINQIVLNSIQLKS